MTCRKPGLPPRCLINLIVPSQSLWLEFSHLGPQSAHKRFKDFTNHNFCFQVWIKYEHTFLSACYFVKGAGLFSTIMCCKIGLQNSSTEKTKWKDGLKAKEIISIVLSVSSVAGHWGKKWRCYSLTAYEKGIWWMTSVKLNGMDPLFPNCHHSIQQLHGEWLYHSASICKISKIPAQTEHRFEITPKKNACSLTKNPRHFRLQILHSF